MKNSQTEINKIINQLSDNISLTQTDESYVLQDKQNMMSFSLDLYEYEKIIIENKTHVLKKIFKKEGLKVLDCTGGFGRDSAIIASLGNNDVTLIEDNPMIMKILRDAIRRIKSNKIEKIFNSKRIEMRVCPETKKIISGTKIAREEDYYEEYLGPIISIKIVKSIDEAIEHIN